MGAWHGQMDKLLVSRLLPVAALGAYGFASTMVAGGLRIVSSVFQAILPAFAELTRRGDHDALLRRYQRVHALITLGSAPLFAGITFAAPPVFHYVLGDAFSQNLMLPTALLCVGSFMNAGLIAPYAVSLAMGRPDIAAKQNAVALLVV